MRGLRKKGKEIRPTTAFIVVLLFLVVMLVLMSYGHLFHRDLMVESDYSDPVMSYCSKKADSRGPHQNVIAYSLYGNFSDPKHFVRYTGAIKYILSNISQVYSGA
jgi:hypothetical protein